MSLAMSHRMFGVRCGRTAPNRPELGLSDGGRGGGGVVTPHGRSVAAQPRGNGGTAPAPRGGNPRRGGGGGPDPAGGPTAGPAESCQGPPPWAGKGKPDKAAKAALKQACD